MTPSDADTPLREAAKRYINHVAAIGCDHDGAGGGTHTGCPEALGLIATLDATRAAPGDEETSLALTALGEAIRHAAMLRWEDVTIQAPAARAILAALRAALKAPATTETPDE